MKKRRRKVKDESGIDLNVMPFIDVFSLLCIFLLSSAVFLSIGTHRVQIPFLSNAAKSQDEKSKTSVDISINVTKIKMVLEIKRTSEKTTKESFAFNKKGLLQLNRNLIKVKEQYPELDKATVFFDDNVIYENVIKVVDVIKMRINPQSVKLDKKELPGGVLFSKVIFGSVLH